MRAVVRADIFQPKTLGQIEIHLNCRQLPGAPNGVNHLDVNLRAVKRSFAFDTGVGQPQPVERLRQRRFRQCPDFGSAQVLRVIFRVTYREFNPVLEPERGIDLLGKLQAADDFCFQGFRRAEQVGVVLGKAAHPQQAVLHTRPLVAVHRAHFGVAQRQLPVTAWLGLVNLDVKRAVHRLELVFQRLILELHRGYMSPRYLAVCPDVSHNRLDATCGVRTSW